MGPLLSLCPGPDALHQQQLGGNLDPCPAYSTNSNWVEVASLCFPWDLLGIEPTLCLVCYADLVLLRQPCATPSLCYAPLCYDPLCYAPLCYIPLCYADLVCYAAPFFSLS